MKNRHFVIISGFIFLAAISRLLPHPPNFTAVGAIALFGAAYFASKKWAILIPLLALWLSDLVLNNLIYAEFYAGMTFLSWNMLWVYGSILLIVFAGFKLLKKVTLPRVLTGAFGAALIFFIVSNFGVWLTSPMYPMSLEGLIACYTAAIPFFHYTLAGNLVYCTALFGAYEFLKLKTPQLVGAEA